MNTTPQPSPFRMDYRTLLVAAIAALILAGALYLATASPTITPRFGGADGGELTATALSGGVPHPSGYPTYMLLARTALRLLPGEPAGRLALLSGLSMALAVACTALLVGVCLLRSRPVQQPVVVAALYAALVFATSPRAWSQAIIVEVYAVYCLLLVLTALLLMVWLLWGHPVALIVAAFCLGAGVGTHLTVLALVPGAIAAFALMSDRPRVGMRSVVLALGALLAGLALYGFLPLWAAREMVPTWGDLRTVAGFWQHISGAEYRYLVGIVPWSQRISRISFVAGDLLAQVGPLGVVLAIWIGIPHGWRTQRLLMLVTGSVAVLSLLFALIYGAADGEVYLLPWLWAWSIWAGLGVPVAAAWLLGASSRIPAGRALLMLVLFGSLVVPVGLRYSEMNLHGNTTARDQTAARLRQLPPDTLLLTGNDADTFDAWYVQRALDVRQDVLVVDLRLLPRDWYQAQIKRALGVTPDASVCRALGASPRPIMLLQPRGELTPQTAEVWTTVAPCAETNEGAG